MRELKVDPKFRDLIPPLTASELEQLEKNILEAGEIYEAIVTWNGTIIDGHHRYEIARKHNMDFKVMEKDFENEFAAMAWACRNQLGRRNLTSEQQAYLIGKRLENEKAAYGAREGFRGNRYKKGEDLVRYQNGNLLESEPEQPRGRTAERLAKEYGVGQGTINRAGNYAKGVDALDEEIPGIKDKLLSGKIKVSKATVQEVAKAEPELREEVAKSIAEGDEATARELMGKPKKAKKPEKVEETAKPEEPAEASEPVAQDDVIPEGMRKCITCGKILSESEFYSLRPGRLRNSCKHCYSKRLMAGDKKEEEPEEPTPYNADDLSGEISALAHQTEMALESFIGDFGYVIDSEFAKNKVLSSLDEIVKAANKYAAIVKEKEI